MHGVFAGYFIKVLQLVATEFDLERSGAFDSTDIVKETPS
jgi:hypothetical protein